MPTSLFLARLMGPLLAVMGVGMLLNYPLFQTMAGEVLRNYPLIFLSGFITLTAGLAIVLVHNVWTRDWRVIVTVLGWLAVMGGALRMLRPSLAGAIGPVLVVHTSVFVLAALVWLALGLVLCYFGYRRVAEPPYGSP